VIVAVAMVGLPLGQVWADPVILDTVITGPLPIDVAISPDGTRAYVTNNGSGSVSVIDTTTNVTVGDPITVGSWPWGVAVTPDGSRAYVANYGGGSVSVIDTSTHATVGAPISVGGSPWDVAVTPDGTRAYVTNVSGTVSVIDTVTNRVVSGIALGVVTHGVAVTPDGAHAYVTRFGAGSVSVIDTTTNTTVGDPIEVGALPEGISIAPDGTRAYVANNGGNSVSVIDTSTKTTVGNPISIGDAPWGAAVTAEGSRVYVTNSEGNSVSVIDTATSETSGDPIGVGSGPRGIAVTPDGSRAYVVDSGSYDVSVLALQPSPPLAVTAVAGNGLITGAWQPPVFTGGQPITVYTATASPDGHYCSTDGATTCTITGLTNGTAYTVTVTARNSIGVSARSRPSLAVTPLAPVVPPLPPGTAPSPGKVTGVKAQLRKGRVTVTWRPVADVRVYRVRISKPGARTFKGWTTTTKRVFKAKVRKGKRYRFQVCALGAGGRGPVATIRFKGK
jgi:YVTN family beta-propeller protein